MLSLCVSKIVVGVRMIGLQCQHPPEASLRLLKFPLLGKHIGEAVMRIPMAGFQVDGAPIAGRGRRQIALQKVGVSKVVVIVRRSRIVLDGSKDQWNSDLILAGLLRDDTEVMERIGVLRIDLQDLAIAGFGLRQAARLMVLQTHLQRLGDRSR